MISAVGLSYMAFIILRKFPLCSLSEEVVLPFIINGVLNFGKSLFIYWDGCIIIYSSIRWCGLSQWLICGHWRITESLGWIPLDHGIWSFYYIIGFNWPVICWVFLHVCSLVILACTFLFLWYLCLFFVSWWWWPCRMNLEVFLPLQIYGRVSKI